MDLLRIPMATILFLAATYMLIIQPEMLSGTLGTVGAVVCIGALVYAIALYSNINITLK